MRRRGLQIFTLITFLVILSIVALSVDDLPFVDAAGGGPLGLTLGLDLQGGSLLIYEAELPDEAQVRFDEPVEEGDLRDLLDNLEVGQNRSTLFQAEYTIEQLSLAEVSELELRASMATLGILDQFELDDGILELTFAEIAADTATGDLAVPGPEPIAEDDVRLVLDSLGYVDTVLEATGGDSYRVEGLVLEPRAEERLRFTLDQTSSLLSFETRDGTAEVAFDDTISRFSVQTSLNDIAPTAVVSIPAQELYQIKNLTISAEDRIEFETALATLAPLANVTVDIVEPTEDQMNGVKDIIEGRINALGTTEPIIQTLGDDRLVVQLPGAEASTIDMVFSPVPSGQDVVNILAQLGRTGDTVSTTAINTYSIASQEPLTSDEEELISNVVGLLGPLASFVVTGDRTEAILSYVGPPSSMVISALLDELEVVDFTVETAGNRIVVRVDDPVSSEIQEELRTNLQAVAPGLTSYTAEGGFERAKELINQTAELELKERTCQDISCITFSDSDIGLTGRDLDRAFRGRDPTTNLPVVNLNFNSRGSAIFRDLTTRIAGVQTKRIAIFLDNMEISSPVVQVPILDGRGVITGLTNEEARDLAIQLESGRLPVPLQLIRENTVDALLGADSLRKSLIAGIIGLGLVLLFMVMYYRMAGVVASISLVVYSVLILAIFKVTGITLILSGLAGLILSIGMAVDANILIFERMKEELRAGRTLSSAMEVGFRRAWRAIRDSNLSTILTCLILFLFGSRLGGGTPVVTGFAITLGIGVAVSMFTAYTVSRNLLQIMAWSPLGKKMSLFTPEPRRQPVSVSGGGK